MRNIAPFFIAIALASGCAVNPVTGDRNLNFMSADWEQKVGAQNYAPLRQAQGGDLKVDPELTRYVASVGARLAEHATRPMDYEFNVINDSVPNAWALPGGKISINRGLLTELQSEAELAAVLGHEIVHADAAHGARAQSRGVLTQVGSVAAMIALGSQVKSEQAQQLGMLGVQVGAQLVTTKYGRDAERESDLYGMQYMSAAGYDPQGAVDLQETFVRLSEGRNSDWLSGLFASHPPSQERVENNRETAATLPPGGDMGRERYQQKTAYLREIQPAYEKYDEARKALSEDDLLMARDLVNEAREILPQEAHFHALSGDIYYKKDQFQRAESEYSVAIDRNRDFFYPYLRRGLTRNELGRRQAAKADLEQSLKLLPTAQAQEALGQIALASGQRQQAVAHFQEAAQSDSPAGQRANTELARMNPLAYVNVRTTLNNRGAAYAIVENRAPVEVQSVQVKIETLGSDGRVRETTRRLNGPFPPGRASNVPLNLNGYTGMDDLNRRLRVTALAAQAR